MACLEAPEGWTCDGEYWADDKCDCGCGILDPSCPDPLHFTECWTDHCGFWEGPSPTDPTQCVEDPPQDDWTCDMALLYDGDTCDCGCGAPDPDCPTGSTEEDCDDIHCGSGYELKPGDPSECWVICEPLTEPVGDATCTNGGESSFEFGSEYYCEKSLYSCTDGRSYAVECENGDCLCRVNGQCVAHASSSFCDLNFACGWTLIDDT